MMGQIIFFVVRKVKEYSDFQYAIVLSFITKIIFVIKLIYLSDCPNQFSKAKALYCNKDCGANWLDNEYGCQIDDADAYCRLIYCNANAIAKKFDVLPATNQPGFSCRGIGMRFHRKRNGADYGYHGILDFNYVDDIKAFHGEGNVITNVVCENKTGKFSKTFFETSFLLKQ